MNIGCLSLYVLILYFVNFLGLFLYSFKNFLHHILIPKFILTGTNVSAFPV